MKNIGPGDDILIRNVMININGDKNIKAKEVSKSHFESAMGNFRPSITEDIMRYYEKVKEDLGSGIAKKDKREKDIQYI